MLLNSLPPPAAPVEEEASFASSPSSFDDTSSFVQNATLLQDDEHERTFAILKRLGEGAFGVCVKLNLIQKNTEYAAKLLPKRKLSQKHMVRLRRLNKETKAALLNVSEEIDIHKGLRHPGIVEFHSWFSDRFTGRLALVLEYCPHGSLRQVMRHFARESRHHEDVDDEDEDGDNNGKGVVLPTTVVQRWGAQLLSALNYLHKSPVLVAHRDINPDNLLVDMALNVRLCDFGLASRLTNDDSGEVAGKNVIQNSVGTVNYIAPEVVLYSGSAQKCDLRAADVWSAGVVLHEALTGQVPFELCMPRGHVTTDTIGIQDTGTIGKEYRNKKDALVGLGFKDHGSVTGRDGGHNQLDHTFATNAQGGPILTAESAALLGAALHRDPTQRLRAGQLIASPFFRPIVGGSGANNGMPVATALDEASSSSRVSSSLLGHESVPALPPSTSSIAPPTLAIEDQRDHRATSTLHLSPKRRLLLELGTPDSRTLVPRSKVAEIESDTNASLIASQIGAVSKAGMAPTVLLPPVGANIDRQFLITHYCHGFPQLLLDLGMTTESFWKHTLSSGDPHGDRRWLTAVAEWVASEEEEYMSGSEDDNDELDDEDDANDDDDRFGGNGNVRDKTLDRGRRTRSLKGSHRHRRSVMRAQMRKRAMHRQRLARATQARIADGTGTGEKEKSLSPPAWQSDDDFVWSSDFSSDGEAGSKSP